MNHAATLFQPLSAPHTFSLSFSPSLPMPRSFPFNIKDVPSMKDDHWINAFERTRFSFLRLPLTLLIFLPFCPWRPFSPRVLVVVEDNGGHVEGLLPLILAPVEAIGRILDNKFYFVDVIVATNYGHVAEIKEFVTNWFGSLLYLQNKLERWWFCDLMTF